MFAIWSLSKYGPPAVDTYFLPTIEYVSDTFHAIAPSPVPATASVYAHTPVAAEPTFTIPETIFVRQTGSGTRSVPERSTITVLKQHFAAEEEEASRAFYATNQLYSRIYRILESIQGILMEIKAHICASFPGMVPPFGLVAWFQIRYMQYLRKLATAEDFKIMELSLANHPDVNDREINRLRTMLEKSEKDSKRAEEQYKTELDELKSSLTDKDNKIIERDGNLAMALKRAESAEKSNKALENKAKKIQSDLDSILKRADTAEKSNKNLEYQAKKSQSDLDSALKKKENEIEKHKHASEQAAKDGDTVRGELKSARAQAVKDSKTIDELQKQATVTKKTTAELESQIRASIGRKDEMTTKLQDEKQELMARVKTLTVEQNKALKVGRDAANRDQMFIGELRGQVAKANSLCKAAEGKASTQEAMVADAIEQQKVAKEKASEQEAETKELENRVEALIGRVADLVEENERLRAASDDTLEQKTECQEEGNEADVEVVPPKAQRQSRTLPYNRNNKLRSNKRLDGSIRTSKHPQTQPPTHEPRFCRFFQRGNCKFGAKCLDIHELPASSHNRPAPSQEPFCPAPEPASVHQTGDHQSHASPAPTPVRPICGHYQRGHCRFGAKCRDSHNMSLG